MDAEKAHPGPDPDQVSMAREVSATVIKPGTQLEDSRASVFPPVAPAAASAQPATSTALQKAPAQHVAYSAERKYDGAGIAAFGVDVQKILGKVLDPKIAEITPDGRIYVPTVHFRRVLNEAFGRGGWIPIPISDRIMKEDRMYREYAIYAGSRFIAEAVGEQQYSEKNSMMSYGDAAEGCKSNALMRCCKWLDIYTEAWDPVWRRDWKGKWAVIVNCESRESRSDSKWLWKRKDTGRLYSGKWREIQNGQHGGGDSSGGGGRRPAPPAARPAPAKPAPRAAAPPGNAAPAPSPAGPTVAPPARSGHPPSPPVTPAPQGAATASPPQRRDPMAQLHGHLMANLKRAAGTTKDEVARDYLEKLTGKRKLHDFEKAVLQQLAPIVQKLAQDQATTLDRPEGVRIVVDAATSAVLWPPDYKMQEVNADAAAPEASVDQSLPEDGPPPQEQREPSPGDTEEEFF